MLSASGTCLSSGKGQAAATMISYFASSHSGILCIIAVCLECRCKSHIVISGNLSSVAHLVLNPSMMLLKGSLQGALKLL